jgi:hypothetical protein
LGSLNKQVVDDIEINEPTVKSQRLDAEDESGLAPELARMARRKSSLSERSHQLGCAAAVMASMRN